MIHPTAIIDPSAEIASDVTVGPYSVIGPQVKILSGTIIAPHVVIQGPAIIGCDNQIFQFASIGALTQDKKYTGTETYLEIGDRNIFREFCTINRSTSDQTKTIIGNDNLFMAYTHVAHDCIIGNHNVFANNASLAGHVIVEDSAILSGFAGVFQFCRIGAYSFAATNSVIIKDVPPFMKVSGYYAKPFGLNKVGLQRKQIDETSIKALTRAYKIIYRQGLTLINAIEELKAQTSFPQLTQLISFLESSKVGIVR